MCSARNQRVRLMQGVSSARVSSKPLWSTWPSGSSLKREAALRSRGTSRIAFVQFLVACLRALRRFGSSRACASLQTARVLLRASLGAAGFDRRRETHQRHKNNGRNDHNQRFDFSSHNAQLSASHSDQDGLDTYQIYRSLETARRHTRPPSNQRYLTRP